MIQTSSSLHELNLAENDLGYSTKNLKTHSLAIERNLCLKRLNLISNSLGTNPEIFKLVSDMT